MPMPDPEEQHRHGMVPEIDHAAWRKVKHMYEVGDFDTIDRMIKREEAYQALGRVGKMIQAVVIWIGVIGGSAIGAKAWFDAYIKTKGGG